MLSKLWHFIDDKIYALSSKSLLFPKSTNSTFFSAYESASLIQNLSISSKEESDPTS